MEDMEYLSGVLRKMGLDTQNETDIFYYMTLLFEKHRGMINGEIHEHIHSVSLSKEEIRPIKLRLQRIANSEIDQSIRLGAVFCLGKLCDHSLKFFFRHLLLESYSKGLDSLLFQCMIALDNIDERIFARRDDVNSEEIALNRNNSREYLRGQGLMGN